MNKKLGIVIIVVLIIIVVALFAMPFFKAYDKYHGDLGDNVKWSLTEDGAMTVSGTGEIDPEGSFEKEDSDDFESDEWEFGYWYFVDKAEQIKTAVLEEGITEIGEMGFANLVNLTSVQLPSTLISIDDGAFMNTGLESVDVPASVKDIGDSAFYSCGNLKDIQLHDGLQTIGEMALYFGSEGKEVHIPETVISVDECFLNFYATDFDLYMYPMTAPETDTHLLGDVNKNLTIHVRKGASGYDKAPWNQYNVQYDITE